MDETTYWKIALVLMGLVILLYMIDLAVFLMQLIPAWYFAPDEAYLEDAYYSAINKQTTEYAVTSLAVVVLFVASAFLFLTKNKYGFYLSALSGVIYLVQTLIAATVAADFGDFALVIVAFFILIAVALLFCVWKSKGIFKIK